MRNIAGLKFNSLTVVSEAQPYYSKSGKMRRNWSCKCDCGKSAIVRHDGIVSGKTKSCGCLQLKRVTSHGMAKTRLYGIWTHIKARTLNAKSQGWKMYGGRGIGLHPRWHCFENFQADLIAMFGREPNQCESIDRVDNSGDYAPSNVRYATAKQQARNTRSNQIVSINGFDGCVSELSELHNINCHTIYSRIRRGWVGNSIVAPPNKRIPLT